MFYMKSGPTWHFLKILKFIFKFSNWIFLIKNFFADLSSRKSHVNQTKNKNLKFMQIKTDLKMSTWVVFLKNRPSNYTIQKNENLFKIFKIATKFVISTYNIVNHQNFRYKLYLVNKISISLNIVFTINIWKKRSGSLFI